MMNKTICIIGALKEEIAEIKERMVVEDSMRLGSAVAFSGFWKGKRVLLLLSGIGKYRAQNALSNACVKFSLSTVISIGYAGGLDPDLREGDLVIANRVFDSDVVSMGLQSAKVFEICFDETLINQVLEKCPESKSHRGGLITLNEAICEPEKKRDLGNRFPVVAVDMETAGLLSLAVENQLSFLSVRSITDTVDHELVSFANCVDETGKISTVKVGWHILTHLGTVPKIRKLRDHCRKATHNLTHFVEEFLRLA